MQILSLNRIFHNDRDEKAAKAHRVRQVILCTGASCPSSPSGFQRTLLLMTCLRQRLLPIVLGNLLFFISPLFAASDVQVSAELSRHRVAAGEIVQLDVKVTGAQEADVPRTIPVDGLQINLAGQSKQVQMVNLSVSSCSLYSYIVIPLRTGTFTIPAIEVRADGKYFRTQPQELIIEGSSASSRSRAQTPLSPSTAGTMPSSVQTSAKNTLPSNHQIGFSELSLSKKRLYVGEVVPAEIRFYVDARYSAAPRRNIDFSNEGLLVERLSDPLSSTEERNGILYNVATFRTFVSAVKPGPINIGPASLELAVDLPMASPADMPDVFAQLLGRSGGVTQHRSLTLKSNQVSLEVTPLPGEGRPDNFSGAIGEFKMDAMALPQKYSLGDPVTLVLTIEGDGNIKAIGMPQLTGTEGWKIYPSTDRIGEPDAAGLHGVKTFETSMITQEPKTSTPGSLFSYFNPTTGKYVTLTTKPQALNIIPSTTSPLPSSPVATKITAASSAKALPSGPPALAPKTQPLSHESLKSWQPLLYRTQYLIASGVLLAVLVFLTAYLGVEWYEKKTSLLPEQQLKKLWSELQDEELSPQIFFNKAALYAELLLKQDPARFAQLEDIFKRRDEIHYGARERVLRARERAKILEKLTAAQSSDHS